MVPRDDEPGTPELSRVERKRIRRVNEILRVAAEVVAERGYQNASLDEVAERLDLAKATLYHYFENKQALVEACLDTAAAEVQRRLTVIAAEEGTATERLRALIIAQQVFTTQDYPELSRLFLRHLEWPPALLDKIHGWLLRHDQVWKEILEEGLATGEFVNATDPAIIRHCIHGALDFVPFWYQADGKYQDEEFFGMVADTVLLMLGVEARPPARVRSRRPPA